MLTKAPKGTKDIMLDDATKWQYLEEKIREVCAAFNYGEIRTPTFEHTELFERGVGGTTDVVEKQMYTFLDKGERSITLRPEGTASAARAYLENNVYAMPAPAKFYYIIPCFRYEKPQAGRLRQFHQWGVEVFGAESPTIDAEIIALAVEFLSRIGLEQLELKINSMGCPSCRSAYNEKLKTYLKQYEEDLCPTCISRLERNPVRILDCKSPVCSEIAKNAPRLIDYICSDCENHFSKVKEYLTALDISYEVDSTIVRGLDYYTKTVFEVISNHIGSQSAVCGGGRYDGLVEELGGTPTSGIGFALGLERLILTMEKLGLPFGEGKTPDIFFAIMGDNANVLCQKLVYELRKNNICAECDHVGRSLKAQMKYADKIKAKFTAVIGDSEIESGVVQVKNMETGARSEMSFEDIKNYIK